MDDMGIHIMVCKTFHKNRNPPLKYGQIPAKEPGKIPRDIFMVDLIGPYQTRKEDQYGPIIL